MCLASQPQLQNSARRFEDSNQNTVLLTGESRTDLTGCALCDTFAQVFADFSFLDSFFILAQSERVTATLSVRSIRAYA